MLSLQVSSLKHFQLDKVFSVVVKVRRVTTTACGLRCWTLHSWEQFSRCKVQTYQHLTFVVVFSCVCTEYLLTGSDHVCWFSEIQSQEYSEGEWRLEIISTGSWWGSLNCIGNGSREGIGKERSIFGQKINKKHTVRFNVCCVSLFPYLCFCDTSQKILHVKTHLL